MEKGILLLADAWEAGESDSAGSADIAEVRRLFEPFGVAGRNDREFVENCRRWYVRNRPRLILNEDFGRNTPDREVYLFRTKEGMLPVTAPAVDPAR
jgi:hypothetical protein